jgi:hypothetical protein
MPNVPQAARLEQASGPLLQHGASRPRRKLRETSEPPATEPGGAITSAPIP